MKIYDYILCSGSGNRFLLFDTLRSDLSGLNIAAFAAEELHRFGVDGLLLDVAYWLVGDFVRRMRAFTGGLKP